MKTLVLKKKEEKRLLAGHLWIFSNEIDTKNSPLKNYTPGEIVEIKTANDRFIAKGYLNPHTLLAARVLSFDPNTSIDVDFFILKITGALKRREVLFDKPFYRLIYSEGDLLPGLIVDRFENILVVQLNTAGMENLKEIIVEALVKVVKPKAILLRNNSSIRAREGLSSYIETAYGKIEHPVALQENGITFNVPVETGQKTGWFYDQRSNRAKLAPYTKDKKVLDVFSYGGAFSVMAAINGAKEVVAIDSSETALEQLKQNATLNGVMDKISAINNDAFAALDELQQTKKMFDIVIIDPPAFIKKQKDIPVGTKAYLRLHRAALKVLQKDGILFTTSCSLHLSRDMLLDILNDATQAEKRQAFIFEELHQSQDHPIHPAIMETNYLKGFIAIIK
jgi:23S rRNA (cytosine1962-C5)-methyltransferase